MGSDAAATFGELLRQYRTAARLTQEGLAARAGLSARGVQDLERGIRRSPFADTTRRLAEALGLGEAERAALQQAISRAGSAGTLADVSTSPGALPLSLSSFIGREEAMLKLQLLLAPLVADAAPARLVTLLGAGGCGKTRLALRVAQRMSTEFPDGVWFADLSSISDAALVPTAVLSAFGGHESPGWTPLETLLGRVQGRRLLLLLDNCEHLIEACAELVSRLLGASSGLCVLTTSREALRVSGEIAWRVPSLAVPEPAISFEPDRLLQYDAVRLLVDRIGQVNQDFSLSADNAATVARICRRLDGIPLALELAAARASALSVQEIATRLDDCFHLLTGGSRTALQRHRTLRATIDWSHELLSASERTLFRRLAVFSGGWTLEAAEAVCEGEPLPRTDVVDVLVRLIEQSLVSVESHDGRTRYRFLETVRAYAAERLQTAGETLALHARHRAWCLSFAERAAEGLTSPDQVTWFRVLSAEHDNVRTALDSCQDNPSTAETQLRMVAAMGRFWLPHKTAEGRRQLAAALEQAPAMPSSARSAALYWRAMFELYFGDPASGRQLARLALADARAVDDAYRASWALHALVIATDDDDDVGRLALLEQGLALARAANAKQLVALLLATLGAVAAEGGDLERAQVLLDESDGLARRIGDAWPRLASTSQLGWLAIAEDRLGDAESHFRTLLDLGAGLGSFHTVPGVLGLGQVSLRCGDVEHARAEYCRLLLDIRESEPGGSRVAEALVFLASVEQAAGLHGRAQRLLGANEAWHTARGGAGRIWSPNIHGPLKRGLVPVPPMPTASALVQARAEGRAMSLDQAVTYALEAEAVSLFVDPGPRMQGLLPVGRRLAGSLRRERSDT